MKETEFKEKALALGLELNETQLKQYRDYIALLKLWNQKMNLTAIDDDEGIYLKHFYDSLLSIKYVKYEGTLADVGSGAGFPGLVLKIAYPELKVDLIEPIKKRCTFLKEVIETLDLKDVEVINERSEDLAKMKREKYDIVTARAVADLSVLSELCAPLVKVKGLFIALKGQKAKEETKQALEAFKKLGLSLDAIEEIDLDKENKRSIVILKKVGKCPKKYPRPYAEIKRKAL